MGRNHSKSIFALSLVLMGVLLALQNFNIPFIRNISIGSIISILWPLFILIPGIRILKERFGIGGLILTFIGGSFLIENISELFNLSINIDISFLFKFIGPGILIYIGYKIITANTLFAKSSDKCSVQIDIDNDNRGPVKNIAFASKDYVFSASNMVDGITTLDLDITFGGAEIKAEKGVQVIFLGTLFLGGYEFFGEDGGGIQMSDKLSRYKEDGTINYEHTLIVKSKITCGGIEFTTI